MHNMVADIICKTFTTVVGKFQAKAAEPKALMVSFSTRLDYDKEEGYRQVDLLIYGPLNYVQVWTRSRWTVIPLEALIDDGDGDTYVAAGKNTLRARPNGSASAITTPGGAAWWKTSCVRSGWRSSDSTARVKITGTMW